MEENKHFDKKSISFLKGKNTDWDELAKDCVCFANAQGGVIAIGIEDNSSMPDHHIKRLQNFNSVRKKSLLLV